VRVVVTGAGGLLGGAVALALRDRGHLVVGTIRDRPGPPGLTTRRLALEHLDDVAGLLVDVGAEVVVHAAYSVADLERDVVDATSAVATACTSGGVDLIAISTDAVFDGEHAPYAEDDEPRPIHDYGRAKRVAEIAALAAGGAVARSALIASFEPAALDPASRWLVEANRRGERITLFADEVRAVVELGDLVDGLVGLVELPARRRAGCWHFAGPVALSRAELGAIVTSRFDLDESLIDVGRAAEIAPGRPRDVTMSCRRAEAELSFAPRPVGTVFRHGQTT
jgi:dTDP-4-dehydrorhamnose reductase